MVWNSYEILLGLYKSPLLVVSPPDGPSLDRDGTAEQAGLRHSTQGCANRQCEAPYLHVGVIGPLKAIDQRPALERHSAPVRFHVLVGNHSPNWHRQVKLDHITR